MPQYYSEDRECKRLFGPLMTRFTRAAGHDSITVMPPVWIKGDEESAERGR